MRVANVDMTDPNQQCPGEFDRSHNQIRESVEETYGLVAATRQLLLHMEYAVRRYVAELLDINMAAQVDSTLQVMIVML